MSSDVAEVVLLRLFPQWLSRLEEDKKTNTIDNNITNINNDHNNNKNNNTHNLTEHTYSNIEEFLNKLHTSLNPIFGDKQWKQTAERAAKECKLEYNKMESKELEEFMTNNEDQIQYQIKSKVRGRRRRERRNRWMR